MSYAEDEFAEGVAGAGSLHSGGLQRRGGLAEATGKTARNPGGFLRDFGGALANPPEA